jgi:hypothetical protein
VVESTDAVILSGSAVRADNVHLLATMLDGDELATKLERAITNNNTIVALSIADRERIVAVITGGPAASRSCAVCSHPAQETRRERGTGGTGAALQA